MVTAYIENNENQFYPTPDEIVNKMLDKINSTDRIKTILEPSAGKGNIIDGIIDKFGNKYSINLDVDYIEIDNNLQAILKEKYSDCKRAYCKLVNNDFLKYQNYKEYDLIAMNPPFKNGDLHLLKAIDIQKDGGKIVCLLNAGNN